MRFYVQILVDELGFIESLWGGPNSRGLSPQAVSCFPAELHQRDSCEAKWIWVRYLSFLLPFLLINFFFFALEPKVEYAFITFAVPTLNVLLFYQSVCRLNEIHCSVLPNLILLSLKSERSGWESERGCQQLPWLSTKRSQQRAASSQWEDGAAAAVAGKYGGIREEVIEVIFSTTIAMWRPR